MAIYKNREVGIIGPAPLATVRPSMKIRYLDGLQDDVSLSQIRFTQEEKNSLLKQYPSQFDDIEVVSDEDVKAVRVGVAPSFDPSVKEQAKAKVQNELQSKMNADQQKRVTDEAKSDLDKKVDAPVKPAQVQVKK